MNIEIVDYKSFLNDIITLCDVHLKTHGIAGRNLVDRVALVVQPITKKVEEDTAKEVIPPDKSNE